MYNINNKIKYCFLLNSGVCCTTKCELYRCGNVYFFPYTE